ncbi:hypothetical protein SOV_50580 [Sporomusa ovata DSM 2662]|uniref:DUF488 domain-containing protein n=1 Tax=Sporomusa ovata TaxID=2378 RepID=A0A0U1L0S7_9FIRM|nr:DUF488 domain-containing protein [Sporomusa ovata]EQB27431.1 hypothetical protein SOV_2c03270 [Sporomusa ovata DSM 2662]CQR73276.1 hypothetical protein SpAn4DRAFT_2508 [Sporomusa ovata]
MNKIYTIGHSSHKIEYFLYLLKAHSINCLVDVRSMPFSRYTPQFNMNELKKFLNNNGLYYLFMGKELGARREDKSLYTKEGYLDFEKVSNTSLFNFGIERIKSGIEKGFSIALMCTEKDPINCHRNILVARNFYKQNYQVENILQNGEIQNQRVVEKRLLDTYFPNRMQQTLFDSRDNSNSLELIEQAYRLRNKDIGYSISEEKESLAE